MLYFVAGKLHDPKPGSPSKEGAGRLLRTYNGLGEANLKGDDHALEPKHTKPALDDD